MDYIERFFSISPDGGDGSLEILLLVLLISDHHSGRDALAVPKKEDGRTSEAKAVLN